MAAFTSLQLGARAPRKAGPGSIVSKGVPGVGRARGHELGNDRNQSVDKKGCPVVDLLRLLGDRCQNDRGAEMDRVWARWPAAGWSGHGPGPAGCCVCAGIGRLGGWRPPHWHPEGTTPPAPGPRSHATSPGGQAGRRGGLCPSHPSVGAGLQRPLCVPSGGGGRSGQASPP